MNTQNARGFDKADVAVLVSEGKETVKVEDIITTSTGVTVRCNRVSPLILGDIPRKFKKPRPPISFNEDLGKKEENPNHPEYKADLAEWESSVSLLMIDVMLLCGTKIEKLPKAFPDMDAQDFIDEMEILGFDIVNPKKKYLAYLKYKVCANNDDVLGIVGCVSRLSGVSEEDVQKAQESFRADSEG